ncbi:hypothetical protein [Methanosarcina acetivorans]|uniref:hypothetical protein n=1 Tax=Methanosarcina acetivorans TaxID=2214 RepID=UPI001D04296D
MYGKRDQGRKHFPGQVEKALVKFNQLGVDNQEEFLFVGQFCSSPYITKFTRDEVMKEYVFLHKLVDEGIKTGEIKDFSAELIIAMFYQASRTVVNFIFDSDSSLDKNKTMEDGFQIVWRGLAKN